MVTHKDLRDRISAHVLEILRERDMTLAELAEELGVSRSYIHQVVRQHCDIGMKGLVKIANALNLDPAVFLQPIEK